MMIAENVKQQRTIAGGQPPEFFERLDQIRDRGYEMMASAQTAGVFNLSAPVLGPDGKAIAALTCPYIQLLNIPDAPGVEDARKMLVATAQKLSELAGADVVHSSVLRPA